MTTPREVGARRARRPRPMTARGYGPIWSLGIVLAAILVPQGMAYAELAGLPAVTGLYTTIACLSATRSSGRRGCWCWARTRRSPR